MKIFRPQHCTSLLSRLLAVFRCTNAVKTQPQVGEGTRTHEILLCDHTASVLVDAFQDLNFSWHELTQCIEIALTRQTPAQKVSQLLKVLQSPSSLCIHSAERLMKACTALHLHGVLLSNWDDKASAILQLVHQDLRMCTCCILTSIVMSLVAAVSQQWAACLSAAIGAYMFLHF